MEEIFAALQNLSDTKLKLLGLQRVNSHEQIKDDIAIIGMSCRFPGGINNSEEYWQALASKKDCITRFSGNLLNNSFSAKAGLMGMSKLFDPQFFNISPLEASYMDPQQRLMLLVAWEAVENAAVPINVLQQNTTSVFIGVGNPEYYERLLSSDDGINGYTATSTMHSVISGRLSYFLDIKGPSISVDVGCSSSLVALHLACQSLLSGESSISLVGGVNLIVSSKLMEGRKRANMLSPEGKCKVFDATADGYVPGEGCGVLILKRYTQAIENKDNILAVIKGSALNQDGQTSSLTAPNGISQVAVIKNALKKAGISPRQISYIETHGTGTPLGDPIEVNALSEVFSGVAHPIYLGSVKANIGHLEGAAGMASIIKTILAMQYKQIPPQINFTTPNPLIPFESSNFIIPTELTSWQPDCDKRIAGISAFSFMGTNAHVIIEENIPILDDENFSCKDLILPISAKTPFALQNQVTKLLEYISNEKVDIHNVCYTSSIGRTHFPYRIALYGKTKEDFKKGLSDILLQKKNANTFQGKKSSHINIKTLFSFGNDIDISFENFSVLNKKFLSFKNAVLECNNTLLSLNINLSFEAIIKTPRTKQNIREINLTYFIYLYAYASILKSVGIKPSAFFGEGISQYITAVLSGLLNLSDAIKLIYLEDKENLQDAIKDIQFNKPHTLLFTLPFKNLGQNSKSLNHPLIEQHSIKDNISTKILSFIKSGAINEIIEVGSTSILSNIKSDISPIKLNEINIFSLETFDIIQSLHQIIAIFYAHGINIEWEEFYKENLYQKCILPNYAFDLKEYWFKESIATQNPKHASKKLYEWLGEPIYTSSDNFFLEASLDINKFPILNDHMLLDASVISGPTQMAIILEAAAVIELIKPYTIQQYFFHKPLVIPKGVTKKIKIIFNKNFQDSYNISLHSSEQDQQKYILHSSGKLVISSSIIDNFSDVIGTYENFNMLNSSTIYSEDFFHTLQDFGYVFDGTFKSLTTVTISDKKALSELNIVSQRMHDKCFTQIDPGLFDSGFQSLLFFLIKEHNNHNNMYVPQFIEELIYYQPLSNRAFVYAEMIEQNLAVGLDSMRYIFVNENKEVAVTIKMKAKKISHSKFMEAITSSIDAQVNYQSIALPTLNKLKPHITAAEKESWESSLLKMAANILGLNSDKIELDEHLGNYGFESVSFTIFADQLTKKYNIPLTMKTFLEHPTIQDLVTFLESAAPIDKELNPLEESLLEMAANILGLSPDRIELDEHLGSYGFESVSFTIFADQLTKKYNIPLTMKTFLEYPTIQDLAGFLKSATSTDKKLDSLEESLLKMAANILGLSPDRIELNEHLGNYGFESVSFTIFADQLTKKYNIPLTMKTFLEYPTIQDLAGFLNQQLFKYDLN